MTEPTELIPGEPLMPTMDAVYRFMRSNPLTSCEMLIEVLALGNEENAEASSGRLREIWRLAGGSFDKKGRAWVEIDLLPQVLRRVIDAAAKLTAHDPEKCLGGMSCPICGRTGNG
jgi:hypothetical protein